MTLEKVLSKIDREAEKSLPVKTKDGITAIRYHRILYVEYLNHCLKFHLSDGSVVTSVSSREPFDTIANELLKDERFLRPHISFVVNLNYVRTITGKDFIMHSGTVLAISRNNYAEIKKRYIDFLIKDEHKC
jgi:DNA-binding LytR/AlgR family response regulator